MCELLSLKLSGQGAILSTQHNGVLADEECTPGAYPRSRSLCCASLQYNADEVHRCSSGDAAREVRESETPCQRSHYWTQWSSLHSAQWWVASITLNGGWGWGGGGCLLRWHHKCQKDNFHFHFVSGVLLPLSQYFRWNHLTWISASKILLDYVIEAPPPSSKHWTWQLVLSKPRLQRLILMVWNQRRIFISFNNGWF